MKYQLWRRWTYVHWWASPGYLGLASWGPHRLETSCGHNHRIDARDRRSISPVQFNGISMILTLGNPQTKWVSQWENVGKSSENLGAFQCRGRGLAMQGLGPNGGFRRGHDSMGYVGIGPGGSYVAMRFGCQEVSTHQLMDCHFISHHITSYGSVALFCWLSDSYPTIRRLFRWLSDARPGNHISKATGPWRIS